MAAKTPFRITPSLGPDLWQASTEFYWDTVSKTVGNTTIIPSYQLGSMVVGNDGHEYVFVKTTGTIASGAQVTAPAGAPWEVATGTGGYTVPATGTSIPAGTFLHVRRTAV